MFIHWYVGIQCGEIYAEQDLDFTTRPILVLQDRNLNKIRS